MSEGRCISSYFFLLLHSEDLSCAWQVLQLHLPFQYFALSRRTKEINFTEIETLFYLGFPNTAASVFD